METVQLTALRTHRYKGKRFVPGDTYEASERDSRILRALRNAALTNTDMGAPTYARRDMQAAPAEAPKKRGRPRKTVATPDDLRPPDAPRPAAPMTTHTPGPPLVDEPAPPPEPPAPTE